MASSAPHISLARGGVLLALAAAAVAQPAAIADAGPTATTVTASPSLSPKFNPATSDYVNHCPAKKPLRLSVSVATGDTVAVDGGKARSGRFSAQIRLKAGQGTRFVIRTKGHSSTYYVRCLPPDFTGWKATRLGPTQAQWYLMTPIGPGSSRYVAISDSNGVPVWWKRTPHPPFNASVLRNGDLAWGRYLAGKFGTTPLEHYEIHHLDGKLVRTLRMVGTPTDLHEFQQLPNGDFLLVGYRPRTGVDLSAYGGPASAKVYDGYVQEITPKGRKVWDWNSKDHIGLSETGHWWPSLIHEQQKSPVRNRSYDIVHINAVAPDGNSLVLSFRHLDAIYRINRATGAVEWKLGGTRRPESLDIVGDPQYGGTTFGGPHDARVLPDGTVTVFDNGTALDRPPRAVRYRVDQTAHTATLLEQIADPAVFRSCCTGSARRLQGGDWVVSWGGTTLVTEANPSGERVFQLTFLHSHETYRAFPIPFGQLSAGALRRGMNTMNPRGRHH